MTTDFTPQQKLDAVQRELDFQTAVYTRTLEKGAISRMDAERQLGIWRAIHADYFRLVEAERLLR